MMIIRNRRVLRIFSIFSMLVFLNQLVFPTVSYALTSGPNQPEYTSYEDAGSSDMVNLLTGDFNFTMPILTVPNGTDAGFTIPLSYHAGIGPDQEASWVGLGWNINVGSITRGVNGFPDDASGESQVVSVKDLTGRRGWNANFLGTSMGWDSQVGHYGVLNLGFKVGYEEQGVSSVGLAGLYVSDGGTSFDAKEFAITVVTVVITILTYGAATTATQVWTQAAMDVASQIASDAVTPDHIPSAGAAGYWKYNRDKDSKLFYTNYWIWLDQTRVEDMYGTLFLDKASQLSSSESDYVQEPFHLKLGANINGVAQTIKRFPRSTFAVNKGAASDITIDLSGDDYINNSSPALLAYDNFQVNGPGISGSIKPYRLETGTVSVPREMTESHQRLNLVPYLDYGTNKVPFMYEGAVGNRYYHHNGGATATSINPYYGVSVSKQSTANGDVLQYDLNDVTFDSERTRTDVSGTKKIPQGRSVEWMTNIEIKNTSGAFTNNTFLDYATGNERTSFRSNFDFGGRTTLFGSEYNSSTRDITLPASSPVAAGSVVDLIFVMEDAEPNSPVYNRFYSFANVTVASTTSTTIRLSSAVDLPSAPWVVKRVEITVKNSPKPDTMIGGFAITGENGMTYHYAIPVYDYDFFSKTTERSDPENKYSTVQRTGQFANTWLLTAITGPDFVDRGGANNMGNGTVDMNDWGYWVKFNYGNYMADYQWRIPFEGERATSDDAFTTYAKGATELYYLNSVETRTHVAVFVKDSRRDNRDANQKSSLRLGEIDLLTRDAYTALTDPEGSYGLRDCSGVHDVVYQYNGVNGSSVSGPARTYIEGNALRRVIFNTDYQLCPGVSNSDFGYGKLTLQSISVLGRNNVKLFPDYKFTYGNNPSYSPDSWDGWGMYSSGGLVAGYTHKASTLQSDATAWSLTSIKSPMGSVVEVAYERDDYSSISGVVDIPAPNGGPAALDNDLSDGKTAVPPGIFVPGERVQLKLYEDYTCSELACEGQDGIPYNCDVGYSSVRTTLLGTVQANGEILLDAPYNFAAGTTMCSSGAPVPTTAGSIIVYPIGNNRKGGNIRVNAITLRDDFAGTSVKTRYIYTEDTSPWSTSSGVVSMEPDYIRTTDQDFYNWIGYPVTPVLYGKVTVLTGKLTNDNDYDSRQVFEFVTPNKNQYESNVATNYLQHNQQVSQSSYSTQLFTTILSRSSMIGKLKSIKQYDKAGTLYANQDYVYTIAPLNDGVMNYQGVFTEGTLLFDVIAKGADRYYRTMRTEFMRYPYVLQKTITTVDGQTTIKQNQNWDMTTGQVLVSDETTPLGVTLRTIQSPAYLQYPELGSKATNVNNKNMLTQMAASYTYRLDNNGNTSGLVSASASTWRKDWSNYRKLSADGTYTNTADLDEDGNGTVSAAEAKRQIWRPYASYVWKGDYARSMPDGTQIFADADKFSFTAGATNTGWQKTGSKERYNHNSALLESKDVTRMPSAIKLGYSEQFTIASAVRARYEEMAFSGAEDRLSSTSAWFGGEVGIGSGSVVTAPVHTGKKALSVTAAGTGFVYKSSGVRSGTTVYRASVWCNSTQGRIYYRVNGGNAVTPTPVISGAVTLPGGTWYRIETEFSLGSVTTPNIEVGVTTASGNAVFDDFRFQPKDAGMTCYVYNPDTQQLEYQLGNDNLYTRYEYNTRGSLTRTYIETIQYGGEKLTTETKDDFRRFHIDQ